MTPQEIAEKLNENKRLQARFSPRYNTVNISYDETAPDASAIEAELTEMGFQANGYGMMRYDGQRVSIASDITPQEKAAAIARMGSATSHPSK